MVGIHRRGVDDPHGRMQSTSGRGLASPGQIRRQGNHRWRCYGAEL